MKEVVSIVQSPQETDAKATMSFRVFDQQPRHRITPSEARELLALNTYEGQRVLRAGHVDELFDKFNRRRVGRTADIGIAHCTWNGKAVMVNGQHICTMALRSEVAVYATIEHAYCDNDRQLADYYAQFDSQASSRTLRELVDIRAVALSLTNQVHVTIPRRVVSGAVFNIPGAPKWSAERKAQLLDTRYDLCIATDRLLQTDMPGWTAVAKHFGRNAAWASLERTYIADKKTECANYWFEFWRDVLYGTGLAPDMSRLHLRDFLILAKERGRGYRGTRICDREVLQKCMRAWNLFMRDEPCFRLIYSPTQPIPPAETRRRNKRIR